MSQFETGDSLWGIDSYDETVAASRLAWQSKLILLLVFPWTAFSVFVAAREWFAQEPNVALWSLSLSAALGVLA